MGNSPGGSARVLLAGGGGRPWLWLCFSSEEHPIYHQQCKSLWGAGWVHRILGGVLTLQCRENRLSKMQPTLPPTSGPQD